MPLAVARSERPRRRARPKKRCSCGCSTDDGIGWGECVASAEPGYLPDTIDSSRTALRDHFLPRAFSGSHLRRCRRESSCTRAALQRRVARRANSAPKANRWRRISARRATHIEAGVAAGFDDDVECVRRARRGLPPHQVQDRTRARRRTTDGGTPRSRATTSRSRPTPTAPTRSSTLKELGALDEFGLQCIEQPLPADALARPCDARGQARHARLPRRIDHERRDRRATRSRSPRAAW